MKIKIEKDGSNPPYSHLQPLVDALLANGNEALYPGKLWISGKEGWSCFLRDKIDFDFVRRTFDLPESIRIVEAEDGIFDTRSYIEIVGGKE